MTREEFIEKVGELPEDMFGGDWENILEGLSEDVSMTKINNLKGEGMNPKKDLKPYNSVIQVCPNCNKLDVSLNDGHTCDAEYEHARQINQDYYWK